MLQVLSSTIADALAFYGKPETTGTERFVRLIDAFFDCLNVRSPKEYMHKRKPNLAPYTNVADIRFEVQICYALETVDSSVSLISFYIMHAVATRDVPGIPN